ARAKAGARFLASLARVVDKNAAHGVAVALGTVRFERLLPGPIERAWSYLADSGKRGEWLASGKMEPRVGSAVELRFEHATLSSHKALPPERFRGHPVHIGRERVTRFEPPKVLGLSWGGGDRADSSDVTFELIPEYDKVRLVITHSGLRDRTAMVEVAE